MSTPRRSFALKIPSSVMEIFVTKPNSSNFRKLFDFSENLIIEIDQNQNFRKKIGPKKSSKKTFCIAKKRKNIFHLTEKFLRVRGSYMRFFGEGKDTLKIETKRKVEKDCRSPPYNFILPYRGSIKVKTPQYQVAAFLVWSWRIFSS